MLAVSTKDTAILVSLVGPIARRIYDQFAKVSVKTVVHQRDIVMDSTHLPSRRSRDISSNCRFPEKTSSEANLTVICKRKSSRGRIWLRLILSSSRPLSHPRQFHSQTQPQSRRRQPSSLDSISRRPPPPTSSQQRQTQLSGRKGFLPWFQSGQRMWLFKALRLPTPMPFSQQWGETLFVDTKLGDI